VKLNLNLDGYKAELLRVILNLQNTTGSPSNVVYRYPAFSTVSAVTASANFKKEFNDFLPGKDFTSPQVAAFLNQEAAQLADAVPSQFGPVTAGFIPAIQVVDSGGDVSVNWADIFQNKDETVFSTSNVPAKVPVRSASPIYGDANLDRRVLY